MISNVFGQVIVFWAQVSAWWLSLDLPSRALALGMTLVVVLILLGEQRFIDRHR